MKIAVLTYSHESNCGAILQAWALKQVLMRMGLDVDVPIVKGYLKRGRIYGLRYAKNFFDLVKSFIYIFFTIGIKDWIDYRFSCEIKKYFQPLKISAKELSQYDFAVIGSDQVWNPNMGYYKLPLYLGEIIPKKIPLIGYALSLGEQDPPSSLVNRYILAVKRFSSVFVREKFASDYIYRICGKRCAQVIDPVLLLRIEDFEKIEEKIEVSEPYIFVYALACLEVRELIPEIMKATGVGRVVYYDGSFDFVPHKKPSGYRRFITPGQMIYLIRNARAVVTSSFHGAAFSVLASTPFIAVTSKSSDKKFQTRAGDLLCRIGEERRMFSISDSKEEMCLEIVRPVDNSTKDRIHKYRSESIDFLLQAVGEIINSRIN